MKHIYIWWNRDRKRQKDGKKAEQSKAKKHEKKQSKDRYARRQHETTYIVWMWIGQHISCDRTRTRAYKPKHKETFKENNNNKRRKRCANSYRLAPQCTYVLLMLDVMCRGCCYALDVAVVVPLYSIAAINSMRAMKCDRFTLSILWRWVACLRWRSIAFATINSFFHSFVLLYIYMYSIRKILFFFRLTCLVCFNVFFFFYSFVGFVERATWSYKIFVGFCGQNNAYARQLSIRIVLQRLLLTKPV